MTGAMIVLFILLFVVIVLLLLVLVSLIVTILAMAFWAEDRFGQQFMDDAEQDRYFDMAREAFCRTITRAK